ncbi:DUF4113 domain-containing protein [Dyadobacter sp. CY351]|uniref:DUF4113 domain-containing protein n=1 Tax=Dyadobacter sp. CY351 TaxID=2909337 RepID=UPI0038D43240
MNKVRLNHGICVPAENSVTTKRSVDTHPHHWHLMAFVDKLEKSMGQNKVLLANQDLTTRRKMKQDTLSPRYIQHRMQ